MHTPAHTEKLHAARAVLVVVDAQERLIPAMHESGRAVARIARAVRGATLLGVPVIATEQYKKGLGATVADVRDALPASAPVIEKTVFSCPAEPAFARALATTGRRQVLLAGVEAHVCVLATALDLLHDGFNVHVLEDAVASRDAMDRHLALRRLDHAGAVVSTTETALFEMLGGKDHPKFKEVQALVK
ncbi:MAG: hydrolase [Thermoplasmatota archaeon]